MKEIGKKIRDLRKEKKLTQEELSEKLGVSAPEKQKKIILNKNTHIWCLVTNDEDVFVLRHQ